MDIRTREFPKFDEHFAVPDSFSGNCRTIQEFKEVDILRNDSTECVITVQDLKTNQLFTLLDYKKHKDPDDELKDLLQELVVIQKLKHVNILQYLEVVIQADKLNNNFILFENAACYMSDLMEHNISKLHNEAKIKNVIRQLLEALSYLEDKSLMHRNIHPGTISFNDVGCLKLCNFHDAVFTWNKDKSLHTREFRYQAPELLMMTKICGTAVDIWSAACIFAELLLHESLFKQRDREQVLNDIFKLFGVPTEEIWPEFFQLPEYSAIVFHGIKHSYNCMPHLFDQHGRHLKENTMTLLTWMFTYNPKYRFTAKECLAFPYFSEDPMACNNHDIVNDITVAVLERKFRPLIKENRQMIKRENN